MRIKKFTARTFAEALELVKKELSQDAIILQTEEKKGLRPHVVVTAGVEEEPREVQSSQFKVQSTGQATGAAHRAYRNATVQELSAEDPLAAKRPKSALRTPKWVSDFHPSLRGVNPQKFSQISAKNLPSHFIGDFRVTIIFLQVLGELVFAHTDHRKFHLEAKSWSITSPDDSVFTGKPKPFSQNFAELSGGTQCPGQ